ncbi:ABC transporter substrate-binding protein [Devosia sp. Root436]|jgi:polar amino acid transport system substrate-binding protein|uniref:transporter substrate-binding domain-containing protein n=1 Tax=Devosia sp. Root436 TaxID=1736537 RepID=UPI0006F8B9C2|nr:transporter substrate-binding domain-containing protein [Devosia sp. Root436]KQX34333.1 ABC transporter substrate-binding protein [Devosia sp. Root436]
MTILEKITRRTASLMLVAGLMAGMAPAAYALTPEEITAKGKLVVGVLTDFPPFAGVDENQNPAGYDDDVAALLAEKLGVELELVPVTGPNRIPYLLTNRVDVLIAALGINAERAKQVNFSNPYSTLDIMVMAPKEREVKGPEDLPKYTVGVTRAGSQDTFLTQVAPAGTNIMRFEDDPASLQALISGQVEVTGASSIHLAMLQRDHPELNIERKFLLHSQGNGIGIRMEDTELLDYVNAFIAEIVANGQLSEINQTWFGSPLEELPPMPTF